MRLGILTSVETRHRYYANRLRAALPVVAVVYEHVEFKPAEVETTDLTVEDRRIVADHFSERARLEEIFFGNLSEWITERGDCRVRHVEPVELNSDCTLRFLEAADVDTVAVLGTDLVRPPLLGRWPGRMLNLHLGLSPYYRGTATNFYPLLNEEPEYVGATIHLLDAGVDAGPILKHVRPTIETDDTPHTIGCKAIAAGVEAMIVALQGMDDGRRTAVPQWEAPSARLYLRRDYDPRQVVELHRKVEAGLIRKYVDRAARVAPAVRLIE